MTRHLFMALLVLLVGALGPLHARADGPVVPPLQAGDADKGKALFNRLGGCANCHGIDGNIAKRPPMSDMLAQGIAKLNPQPADLRRAENLKSRTDEERFVSIKFGHPGTAMYPKKNLLRDDEIAHLLAYLAILRTEGVRR